MQVLNGLIVWESRNGSSEKRERDDWLSYKLMVFLINPGPSPGGVLSSLQLSPVDL